jgi:hypothetical protein
LLVEGFDQPGVAGLQPAGEFRAFDHDDFGDDLDEPGSIVG